MYTSKFKQVKYAWSQNGISILNHNGEHDPGNLLIKTIGWLMASPSIEYLLMFFSSQGSQESLRGPGQNICSDCFNKVFGSSIRVYWSCGAHKQSGAQGKMPPLPPLSAALSLAKQIANYNCQEHG